ncbi:hypothetical protein CVS30_03870 [Arthrobacter psychrolactophilus]|uniref:Uncharacterized protein n=1 Tax=Arthrobacter psychrolactophilus TaxID=92442 RepID=A0A2V5JNA4_9MICC|nr:hypothetical protein CVS30_03870 [Arthrobacter psychrolactophilus]
MVKVPIGGVLHHRREVVMNDLPTGSDIFRVAELLREPASVFNLEFLASLAQLIVQQGDS